MLAVGPAVPQRAERPGQPALLVSARLEPVSRRSVTGPANVGGPNNSSNDPSGAGNAGRNTPGTNSGGTAKPAGSTSGGGAPMDSITVGTSGNPAGGATGGRIDGTVTSGPAMQAMMQYELKMLQDSKVDKKIKSIARDAERKTHSAVTDR